MRRTKMKTRSCTLPILAILAIHILPEARSWLPETFVTNGESYGPKLKREISGDRIILGRLDYESVPINSRRKRQYELPPMFICRILCQGPMSYSEMCLNFCPSEGMSSFYRFAPPPEPDPYFACHTCKKKAGCWPAPTPADPKCSWCYWHCFKR